MSNKLKSNRFLIARRISQATVALLFIGANAWGWRVLTGNLSLSKILDTIPLADPHAVIQMLAAGVSIDTDVVIGAGVTLVFYMLLAGRGFCSWVCPLNAVTDLANWLRDRLGVGGEGNHLSLARSTRYRVLLLGLVLSALLQVAAFEWISPVAMLHRGLVFGMGLGWLVILGVLLFDLLHLRNGFCGHLCPLGAFYSLVSRWSLIRVNHDHQSCTECGLCRDVCPEHQVLTQIGVDSGSIRNGECTNCGRCIDVCEDDALAFGFRKNS